MSQYLPPLHINRVFNANDYNFQNGSMTYGYAEGRYMRKVGSDTVSGVITFTNSLNVNGPLNITGDIYSNSVVTNNNIALANNMGVANICSVGSLTCLNDINCDSIQVNSNCQYNYKTIGYITCNYFVYETTPPISNMIPLTKSILSLAKLQTYCGIINLPDLLYNYGTDVYLYLYPSYKLVMLDSLNNVIWSSDNTLGTDILYIQINVIVGDLTQIIIYNNNLPIL